MMLPKQMNLSASLTKCRLLCYFPTKPHSEMVQNDKRMFLHESHSLPLVDAIIANCLLLEVTTNICMWYGHRQQTYIKNKQRYLQLTKTNKQSGYHLYNLM